MNRSLTKIVAASFVCLFMLSSFTSKKESIVLENIKLSLLSQSAVKRSAKDTSDIQYYSFKHKSTMVLNEFVEKASSVFVSVCEGNNLVLTAPDYGKGARYDWINPKGYRSAGSVLIIKEADLDNSGSYIAVVHIDNDIIYSEIDVEVKKAPSIEILETQFNAGEKISLEAINPDAETTYTWKDEPQRIISTSSELHLGKYETGNYTYFLEAKKNGCILTKDVIVEVNDKNASVTGLSLIHVLQKGV